MKSLRRSLVTLLFVVSARAAFAQSGEDLDRARALFTDALKDQSDQNYSAALDKLKQVAKVKDTAQVEYRIATCLEALGQSVAAARAYDHAIALGPSAFDADTEAVVQDAHDKRAALTPKIGVLDLGFPATVSSVTLHIDLESVTAASTPRAARTSRLKPPMATWGERSLSRDKWTKAPPPTRR